MRRAARFALPLLVLGMVCAYGDTGDAAEGEIKFSQAEYAADGTLTSGVLASETNFTVPNASLVLAARSEVAFAAEGRLSRARVRSGTTATVGGATILLLGGSEVSFDDLGNLVSFVPEGLLAWRVGRADLRLAARKKVTIDPSGWLAVARLAAETKLSVGDTTLILSPNADVAFWPDGKLQYGTITKDTTFRVGSRTITVAKESRVDFDRNSFLAGSGTYSDSAGKVQIYGAAINLPPKSWIARDSMGRLTNIELANTSGFQISRNLAGLPTGSVLSFGEDGTLRIIVLPDSPTWRMPGAPRVVCSPASLVFLYPKGSVRRVWLESDTALPMNGGTVVFEGHTELELSEDGSVLSGTLAQKASGRFPAVEASLAMRTEVAFYPDGTFRSGVPDSDLAIPTDHGTILAARLGTVAFDDSRRLYRCTLASRSNFANAGIPYPLAASSELYLFPDGSLQSGVLAEDTAATVGGMSTTLKKGSPVKLNEKGTVLRCQLASPTSVPVGTDSLLAPAGTELRSSEAGDIVAALPPDTLQLDTPAGRVSFAARKVLALQEGAFRFAGELAADLPLSGGGAEVSLSAGSRVVLDSAGNVQLVRRTVAAGASVTAAGQTVVFPRETVVYLDRSGKLIAAKTKASYGPNLEGGEYFPSPGGEVFLPGGQWVYLEPDGALSRVQYLEEDTRFPVGGRTLSFLAGSFVSFWKSGAVRAGQLNEGQVPRPQSLPSEEMQYEFSEDGEVIP